ncbi:MAG: L,D-transpeptidase family protein [Acidobacteriota bacterium]
MNGNSKNPRPFFDTRGFLYVTGFLLCLTLTGASVSAQDGFISSAGQNETLPQQKKATEPLSKAEILEAENLLAGLGYWTGAIDGVFDEGSRQALIAFQKITGRKRTGKLTRDEYAALLIAEKPLPREPGYAHVEVDLFKQVLFMVDVEGAVSRILPISSGSGKEFTSEGWTRRAVTPTGKFTVCRKIQGWRKSPLGLLYYPNYICGGIAIHGNPSVPVTPASHGCIRIPMFAAVEFSRLTPVGTIVVVHDEKPLALKP